MNPFDETKAEPNYWLSSMIIDEEAMCKQVRSDTEALYVAEPGKSCPTEILEAISLLMRKADLSGNRCTCSQCTECMSL